MPIYTLKKVKIHNDMSEETTCFSAELYADGKLLAYCKNEGIGGETSLYPAGNNKWNDLPEKVEDLVDDLLTEYEVNKNIRRKLKTKVLFRLPEMKFGEYKEIAVGKYGQSVRTVCEYVIGQYPGAIIANTNLDGFVKDMVKYSI